MKPKSNPLLRYSLATAAALSLGSAPVYSADVTITGSAAIDGMNTDYTVTSPDALTLDFTGVGGDRSTDSIGAAIAKSGGDLTIDGDGILRVTGGSSDVLGIADVFGRTINISLGSGGLIDIQGGAFVNGGWGGGVWLSNLADMNIASGAIFDVWDGGTIYVDALNGAGSVQNGSNTPFGVRSLVVGVDDGSGTFTGVIGGGTGRLGDNLISLTKEGGGTQILGGNNTYAGTTTVTSGTLQIGTGGTSGTLGGGDVSIASDAVIEINRSDAYNTPGGQTFSGAGTLVKNGSGNLTFFGTGPNQNLVSGLENLVVNDGTVRTDSWAQWNSNLNLSVTGSGVFEMWNTTTSIGNLSGDGTIRNSANWSGFVPGEPYATNNLSIAAGNFSGSIIDNGIGDGSNTGTTGDTRINLIKTGGGTLTLSGTNTYSGNTSVTGGTLILGNGTANTSLADAADVSVDSGCTLQLNYLTGNSDTIDELWLGGVQQSPGVYGAGTYSGVTITGTGTLTVQNGPPADPFANWMSTNYPGIVAPDNEPGADPDHDGIANLLEYVLQGGDPSVSNPGILPTVNASGSNFVFSYYRRAAATGTTQTFEYGSTLSSWTPVAIPGGLGVNVTDQGGGIDKVEITVAKDANTKLFGRLQVVK